MNRHHLNNIWQQGHPLEQRRALRAFLQQNDRLRDYLYLRNKVLGQDTGELIQKKVAILSSFTVNQLEAPLIVNGFTFGVRLDTWVGGFNQYEQLIVDSSSALYQFEPDIVLLFLRLEDLVAGYENPVFELKAIFENLTSLIDTLTSRSRASVIVNNLALPSFIPNGGYDCQNPKGLTVSVDTFNKDLVAYFEDRPGVYLFNFNHWLSQFGYRDALDQKSWFYASNPYSIGFLSYLSQQYSSYIKSICGLTRKCLVLDLDNTLWGGVLGEDGLEGIKLSFSYPGNVYRAVQQTVLHFKHRGVLLALNSKNNLEDAREVFEKHPDMVLEWNDFVTVRVNWKHKHENLLSISEELNIGLDSLVFVDDNPAEIEIVSQALPQVETVQFGSDPIKNLDALNDMPWFENLSITASDRDKSQQYQQQAQRKHLKNQSVSLEDYYKSLEMVAEIGINDRSAIKRIAQLTQKTNQYNMTTRRYTESDIEQLFNDSACNIFTLRLRDRFGDNGITGLAITRAQGNEWMIDTFLMSCRIIGRTAEMSLMHEVSKEAMGRGIEGLIGYYIPTPKNKPAASLYRDLGFEEVDDMWKYLLKQPISASKWITLKGTN